MANRRADGGGRGAAGGCTRIISKTSIDYDELKTMGKKGRTPAPTSTIMAKNAALAAGRRSTSRWRCVAGISVRAAEEQTNRVW